MDTKALRQKILDLAIRGKLVPQDPSDEPASVLLERIREQKKQMVKEGKLKAKDIKNDTIIFVGEDNLHYEKFQDGSVKCIEDEIPFELPEGWAWCRLNLSLIHIFSTVTSRYIGSPETQMDRDMRTIGDKGFITFLADVEASALSETFWTVTLPQNLETSSVNSPAFNTFLAAQINMNCNSMLMNGTKVEDLITISGDVHHIFPRSYLKNNGVDNKTKYNQVANYIYPVSSTHLDVYKRQE